MLSQQIKTTWVPALLSKRMQNYCLRLNLNLYFKVYRLHAYEPPITQSIPEQAH